MTIFRIIMAIISLLGMNFIAMQLDKKVVNTTFNAACIGGIACCGIILGLCLGLLFG